MKEYEMKVRAYDADEMRFCYEWCGSELFYAYNEEDALEDALESERAEHIENGHIYVNTSAAFKAVLADREPGHGYVAWTCVDDDGKEHNMIESIEMVERSE